jgi:hypothetical protein
VAVSFLALAVSFWLFSLTLDLVETEISWEIFGMSVALWALHRGVHERAALVPAPPERWATLPPGLAAS